MFSSDRNQMRMVFIESWRKRLAQKPLEPLEQLITEIIVQHPEYHRLLEASEDALERDFIPEAGENNPFLHLSMHISLQEQIQTDRPAGITSLYQQLTRKSGDHHKTEHQLMECLGRMLWEAQSSRLMPDEQGYLDCVRRLVGSRK